MNGTPVVNEAFDIAYENGENFRLAAFRLWIPESLEDGVRAVLVLTPGSNMDGRSLASDPFWMAFAKANSLAIVACCFRDKEDSGEKPFIERYANAGQGSGQALLDALKLFAERSGRREIEKSMLLLFGHSAGGQFSYEFACWKPERALAFGACKGGVYYTHLAPKETREVPGLLVIGEKDLEFRVLSLKGIFALNRRAGAKWALAEEPGAGHEPGRSLELAAAFFESALRLRRKPKGWKSAAGTLGARYGSLRGFKLRKDGELQDDESLAWLPDADFALRWKEFSSGAS